MSLLHAIFKDLPKVFTNEKIYKILGQSSRNIDRLLKKGQQPRESSVMSMADKLWQIINKDSPESRAQKKGVFEIIKSHVPDASCDWETSVQFVDFFIKLYRISFPVPPTVEGKFDGQALNAPEIYIPDGEHLSKDLIQTLLASLHRGDERECIRLLEKQLPVPLHKHRLPPNDDSLLGRAIWWGHDEFVRFLFEHPDVEFDTPNQNQITPLLKAASLNNRRLVEDLVNRKANIQAANEMGANAIYEAAFGATPAALSIIEYFVAHKVRCDVISKDKFTPLAVAVWRGCNIPTIDYLLQQTPDQINFPDQHGETPFMKAFKHRRYEALCHLISKGANVDPHLPDRHIHGCSPLFRATADGDVTRVEELLNNGDDPNSPERIFNRTPLHEAVENSDLEIVKLLLKNPRTDVFKTNNHGRTARDLAPHRDWGRAKNSRTDEEIQQLLRDAERKCIENPEWIASHMKKKRP